MNRFLALRNAVIASLALFVAGALAACEPPPEFTVPLSEAPKGEPDPRLIGAWYQLLSEREPSWDFTVLRIEPGDEDVSFFVQWQFNLSPLKQVFQRNQLFWHPMIATVSEVDNLTYYSLRRVPGIGADYTAASEVPGYIIVRPVMIEDDMLLVCVLHGRNWGPGAAAELLDAAELPYRKLESVGTREYLEVKVSEAGLRDLVRDERGLHPFRAHATFIRMGAGGEELFSRSKRIQEYMETHSCPIRGWPSED